MTLTFAPDLIMRIGLGFARIGALAMLMPLIGERFVPARVRLVFALFISALLVPHLRASFANVEFSTSSLIPVFLSEILIGLILGTMMRMLMAISDLVSQFITQSLGLSLGEMLNPSLGQSTPVLGTYLTLLMLVCFFALDGHHGVIRALAGSYHALPPAHAIDFSDFNRLAMMTLTHAFETALRLAAPFIFFGVLINLGLGLTSKLIPAVPVTFLAVPVSVMMGLFLLFTLVDPITRHFVDDLLTGLSTISAG